MRILLTNDDGIEAKGLEVLERIARHFSDDIWIIAPDRDRSGVSCSLSFSSPMRLFQKDEKKYAVDGTPVDCVMIALHHLMKDAPPDLVMSGINHGQNIAEDLIYSGTVAGAMQGCLFRIKSLSLSQSFGFSGDSAINWRVAEHYAPDLITKLLKQDWGKNTMININFPDRPPGEVEGVSVTRQGRRDHPLLRMIERRDPRRRPYYWMGFNRFLSVPDIGTDLHALYGGRISITPISPNLTNQTAQQNLSAHLSDSFAIIDPLEKDKNIKDSA